MHKIVVRGQVANHIELYMNIACVLKQQSHAEFLVGFFHFPICAESIVVFHESDAGTAVIFPW